MMIDKIGQVNHVQVENKIGKNDHVRGDRSDSISLSQEAKLRAEIYQATEIAKSAELVSDARIAELREKINDPSYINEKIVAATADKIMDAFGL